MARYRLTISFARRMYSLFTSPSGSKRLRQDVKQFICTQELHTVPQTVAKLDSRADSTKWIANLKTCDLREDKYIEIAFWHVLFCDASSSPDHTTLRPLHHPSVGQYVKRISSLVFGVTVTKTVVDIKPDSTARICPDSSPHTTLASEELDKGQLLQTNCASGGWQGSLD